MAGGDEGVEERMGLGEHGLELGMELAARKKGAVGISTIST